MQRPHSLVSYFSISEMALLDIVFEQYIFIFQVFEEVCLQCIHANALLCLNKKKYSICREVEGMAFSVTFRIKRGTYGVFISLSVLSLS